MSFNSATDLLALWRQTSGGDVRAGRMPGVDYIVAALSRLGLINVSTGQTEPALNKSTTVWVKPALQSWAQEASIYLYNTVTAEYELATPALWFALLSAGSGGANFSYLPGGVLMQWGSANIGTVLTPVAFPIAFSAAPNITATVYGAITPKAVTLQAATVNGFQALVLATAEVVNWHAIGRA